MKHPKKISRKNTGGSSAHPKRSFLRSVLLWMAFWGGTAAYAQPFITTWKTDNPGVSNSTSITIPTTGGGYNYEVDWNNDGVYDQTGITGNVTHNFVVAGTYTIRIRGAFPRIFFNNSGDSQKLLQVGQWGDQAWTSMFAAFGGCSNLNISATDLPNLSGVTSMSQMFQGCSSLNGPANIGTWNMANVTDIFAMFDGAAAFNQPIGNWNTANVTDMGSMFFNAAAFNQPIGTWNTANVINMQAMFLNATAFNQLIGTWNTANVISIQAMFLNAAAFNQPIGAWNTANVTDMASIFVNATAFNQSIGNWNTTNVIYMQSMFLNASAFNQPIGNWNTANVSSMSLMFNGATAFNQSIGNWTLNASVDLSDMLDNSGMDCDHYSATLIGWSGNPATPSFRSLGATGRQYGTSAAAARTNLTTIKSWTIIGDAASGAACSGALPVKWLAFTGKQQGNSVWLAWQTASEQNNAGFHVERSEDGLRWTDIGFVTGQGTFPQAQQYSFVDEKPLPRLNYYRLRQTDFDGQAELSKVVSVALQHMETVRVFPNPVNNDETTLFLPENAEEALTARLFSPTGQLIRSILLNRDTNPLDVSGLEPGIYYLEVVGKPEWQVIKIVVGNK